MEKEISKPINKNKSSSKLELDHDYDMDSIEKCLIEGDKIEECGSMKIAKTTNMKKTNADVKTIVYIFQRIKKHYHQHKYRERRNGKQRRLKASEASKRGKKSKQKGLYKGERLSNCKISTIKVKECQPSGALKGNYQ